MKRSIKIILALLVLGGVLVGGFYAYMEPQTWIGGIYLKSKYDPSEGDLQSVSKYLRTTNGGYIPPSFDDFLYGKLSVAKKDSEEYRNILGFYAHQSISSRAGTNIFESGEKYLDSIIGYGRSSSDKNKQLGFLFLAYGIAKKEQAYKPCFFSEESIARSFDYIESGELDKVAITSP